MALPIQTVVIKVTNECNIRCKYCFVEPSAPRGVVINEQIVRRLLDDLEQLATESAVHLVWHGGEPTLAGPGFFRRMRELQAGRSTEFVNLMQTNGTLLTDSYVSLLKELGFRIGLSLDGPRSLNDSARVDKKGRGSFAKILGAMATLRRHDMPFGILATIARHNIDDAETLYRFCREHRVPLKLSPLYHSGEAARRLDSLAISIEEYAHFTRRLAELWLEDDNPVRVDPIEPLLVRLLGGQAEQGCAFSENCHHRFLAVGPTGDLYPCGMFQGFSAYSYGNILRMRLGDIEYSAIFRSMNERSGAIAEKCEPCAIRAHCHGGCPFHALANTGSLNERTPLCRPYKEAIASMVDAMAVRLQHAR